MGPLRPERILDLVGLPDEGDLRARSLAFLRFVLLHLATRDTIRFLEGVGDERAAWAVGFAVCFAFSFRESLLRVATLGGLAFATWKWAAIFPHNSNHFFLEYMCLVFASLASWQREREEDLLVFVRAVRWLPVLVFFWTGVNKALYGTYFNGAYLGSILPHSAFRFVFGFLMSGEELTRLLGTASPGPYAFESPLALLVSNAVWIGEIVAGALLLFARTRALGALLGIALLLGIELGARELMFGAVMTNMLGLYAPVSWSRRLLVGSALFYALLVATRLGWLPAWSFN